MDDFEFPKFVDIDEYNAPNFKISEFGESTNLRMMKHVLIHFASLSFVLYRALVPVHSKRTIILPPVFTFGMHDLKDWSLDICLESSPGLSPTPIHFYELEHFRWTGPYFLLF